MPKKDRHAKRGMATAAADDHLAAAPLRLKKAINRLLSRSPLKPCKLLVLDVLRKANLSEDWDTLHPGCHASRIDGNEEADAEEEVLARLCDAVKAFTDPEKKLVELFGVMIAPMIQEIMNIRHTLLSETGFQKGFKAEHNGTRGGDLDEEGNGSQGKDKDSDNENDDADDGSEGEAEDMRLPFARQLRKALDEAKLLFKEGVARPLTVTPGLGPNALVKIYNLKARPELNGKTALVLRKKEGQDGLGPDDERWIVRMPKPQSSLNDSNSGCEFSLKRTNLVVQNGFVKQSCTADTYASIQGVSESLGIIQKALLCSKKNLKPSKQLRRLIREAVVRRGNMRFLTFYAERNKRTVSSGEILILQLEAAEIVYYSKSRNWKRNPDALWLRGAAQFLRNFAAEAVNDLSAALACRPEKWIMPFRELAETVLGMCRSGLPACLGRWEETFGPNKAQEALELEPDAQPPGRRVGPATCTANGQLYLFGGLRPKTTDATMTRCLLFALSHAVEGGGNSVMDQRPLGDFFSYDLSKKRWRRLSSEGPDPRGFGLLAHDPDTNCLFLFAGRGTWQTHSPNDRTVGDVWKYDVSKDAWGKVRGSSSCPASRPELAAHCLYQRNWYFLETPSTTDGEPLPVQLWRFDLTSKKWHAVTCASSSAPSMGCPATAWEQDGKMFVWCEEKVTGNGAVTLWAVGLAPEERGLWTPYHVTGGLGGEEKRFRGALASSWCEGAAHFDPVARKAYLFGGWTQDLNFGSVQPESGNPCMLKGRYFNLLLEINVDALEMRAVEGVPTEQDYCRGPEERAQAMVTSFTTREGGPGGGEGGPQTTVTVGFGYTTFEVTTGTYSNLRSFSDVWECTLLTDAQAKKARAETKDRWGYKRGGGGGEGGEALEGGEESLAGQQPQKSGERAAAGEVSRAERVARNTQVEFRSFDQDEHFNYLMAQIVNQDEIRKFLSTLAPPDRGRGAFVANLVDKDKCLPVTAETFFTASYLREWLTAAEVRLRFPNLHQVEPKADSSLDKDPRLYVTLIVVAVENVLGQTRVELPDGVDYSILGGSFARHLPGAVYLSEKAVTETGVLQESRDVDGRMGVSQVDAALACNQVMDICSNKLKCPNAEARFQAAASVGLDEAEVTRRCGKLKECSRCKLVKYCGPECQRADWQRHKVECKHAMASQKR